MAAYSTMPNLNPIYMRHERTAYWVRTHSPTGGDFYSPSMPPSELPPTPSSPPSEVESSHSLPPQMILKYPDGRPDIPVPHQQYARREQPYGHARTRSHNPVLQTDRGRAARPGPQYRHPGSPPFPLAPEEIRVLPSDSDDGPRTYPRSKSLPRDTHPRHDVPPPMPGLHPGPAPNMYPHPGPHHPQLRPNVRVNTLPSRPVAWHGMPPSQVPHIPNSRSPPLPGAMYAQPQRLPPRYPHSSMYPSRPIPGPEGMRLTRSDPIQYPGSQKPPFPVFPGMPIVGGDRHSTRGPLRSRPRTPASASDHGSSDSGSTYYVIPTPPEGQKSHVMSPEKPIYTPTSATKSPNSPNLRKPFFHRIFDMFTPSESSRGSSAGSRRLHRRHSTGRRRSHERRVH